MDCTPEDVVRFAGKMFSWSWWKYAGAAVVAACVNFILGAPAGWVNLLETLLVFLVLDFVLGIWASMAVFKHRISSAGVQRTLTKVGLYGAVFIVGACVDRLFHMSYILSLFVLGLAVLREGASIGENTRALWEYYYPDTPFPFERVFAKLQDFQSCLPDIENLRPRRR